MARRCLTLSLTLAVLVPGPAFSDTPIPHLRLIAPAAPGGGWDQTARAMQQVLQAAGLVGTASVENIPGAAGTIGLARFISAERGKGDVVMLSGLIMLGAVVTNRSPVTLADATPLARLIGEYEVIVVPAQSPYRTLADLLTAFREHPEAIAWGGGSAGGTDQILAGLVADAIGVSPRRVNYIAFAGGGESMAAILGGQVSAGINGLAEFAPHIAAGTVRVLGISSAERLPDVAAPTLREQGVDVVIENWRSLVGPPGMRADDQQRLEELIDRMVHSPAWRDTLAHYRWSDRYLAGDAFARFVAEEEARVEQILRKLGTGSDTATGASAASRRYPWLVLAGLTITAMAVVTMEVRRRRRERAPGAVMAAGGRAWWREHAAMIWIAAALALNVLLMERAGFVVASMPLFWLTARGFDDRHPVRDAVAALALAVGAYLLFARLLQISLPAGVLDGWL